MSKNLWPEDLVSSQVRSPVSILREQAAFLERSTDNIVSASVKQAENSSTENPFTSPMFGADLKVNSLQGNVSQAEITNSRSLSFDFYITAPALGNYRYLLFRISYGFDVYPATIFIDGDLREELQAESGKLVVNSEKELEQCLAKVFSASKTKKVISVLFSQVESV